MNKAVQMQPIKQDVQTAHNLRLESLGMLTGGVAHDFNNVLTVIMGNARLLKRRHEIGFEKFSRDDIAHKIMSIEKMATHGADLVARLMRFGNDDGISFKDADINDAIIDTVELLRHTIDKTIFIKTYLSPDLCPVQVDINAFQNMLLNFAFNARDAMPQGGKLVIETNNEMIGDTDAKRYPDMQPGDFVRIDIIDTGTGMTQDVLGRIFEPFFTTKPLGKGTGLGMSLVYNFIKQSGGHVHVESTEGKGTAFHVYLPRRGTLAFADL